jgi:hypothetical protein
MTQLNENFKMFLHWRANFVFDWNVLPRKFNWVTQDYNGVIAVFSEEPKTFGNEWVCAPLSSDLEIISSYEMKIKNPDWKKAIQQRPILADKLSKVLGE